MMEKQSLTKQQWVHLVKRAQHGDVHAFEELCRLKTPNILFICNDILHSWQDAEDATQEVLLSVQKNLKQLAAPEAFPAWLNRLSVTTCWRMRRKQMQEQYKTSFEDSETELQDFSAEALPSEFLESKEARWQVMDAIKSLPYQYRMPLILFYYEEMTAPEIAAVLDISIAVANNNIQRGRQKLKELLKPEDSSGKYIPIAMALPAVINQTEMPIALGHSVNVLNAMGIALKSTSSVMTAAGMLKAIGAFGATIIVIASIGLAVVPELQIEGPLAGTSETAQTNDIQNADESASLFLVPVPTDISSSQELASQPSQGQSSSVGNMNISSSSQPLLYSKGVAVMGRIYINNSSASEISTAWSIAGVEVQLFCADNLSKPIQTTQTMQGEYSGWYVFESLPPGKYVVKPILPRYLVPDEQAGARLQNGRIVQNGQTVFNIKPEDILTLNFPVCSSLDITGRITTSQVSLHSQLSGIVVKLYNSQNVLMTETVTQADGSYHFQSVPVYEGEWVTLWFFPPGGAGISMSQTRVSMMIQAGAGNVAADTSIYDSAPPMLQVLIVGSALAPTINRENAFSILTTDAGRVRVEWSVEDNTGVIVASGHGVTPDNKLDTLLPGSYVLSVVAKDDSNYEAAVQKILYLG